MRDGSYVINFKGLRDFIRNPGISMSEKIVFVDIVLYAGTNGKCFPSQSTLARDLGITSRYIGKILKKLKENGFLSWERGKKGKSNHYILSNNIYSLKENINMNPISTPVRTQILSNIGTTVHSNRVIESNHGNKSQLEQLQLLFEKINKRKCNVSDTNILKMLMDKYSYILVEKAIKEAAYRGYSIIRMGLIRLILNDWEKDKKYNTKASFKPCNINGCENGFKFNKLKNNYFLCDCRKKYEDENTRSAPTTV